MRNLTMVGQARRVALAMIAGSALAGCTVSRPCAEYERTRELVIPARDGEPVALILMPGEEATASARADESVIADVR